MFAGVIFLASAACIFLGDNFALQVDTAPHTWQRVRRVFVLIV